MAVLMILELTKVKKTWHFLVWMAEYEGVRRYFCAGMISFMV